jgi:ankyrin repeat protein
MIWRLLFYVVLFTLLALLTSAQCTGGESIIDAAKVGQLDIVKFLIEKGINVNTQDTYGQAANHNAALAGSVPVLQTLLDSGAQIDSQDCSNLGCLEWSRQACQSSD